MIRSKKTKIKTIQSTLIFTYFFMLIIVFFSIMLIFAVTQTQRINKESFQLITQNVKNISSYLENETDSLKTLANNISYSSLVEKHFLTYLEHDSMASDTDMADYHDIQNTKILIDILTAIIGLEQPASQIYLHSFTEGTFGVGLDTSTSQESITNAAWFPLLNSSPHKKIYLWEEAPRLASFFSYKGGADCLSFYTMYYNQYNNAIGIIEVKKTSAELKRKIKHISSSYGEDLYIYDSSQNCVYTSSATPADYNSLIRKPRRESKTDTVIHTFRNNKNVFYQTSESNGFTTVIAIEKSDLYAPIWSYIQKNILIFIGFSCIALLLAYLVSKSISAPIKQIYSQIKSFQLSPASQSRVSDLVSVNTGILEFNTLYDALIDMQKKAQLSMEHEILIQNQEMHSRMLALQSQMNPHFLYNSLATVQSMAEENMNEEIIQMCQTISKILRYISSDKELLVPLKDEAYHTENYLKCMQMRYEDDIEYSIDIPKEMMSIRLPKLCLQPLAENSIKYLTSSVKAPWKIKIAGRVTTTYWEVSVSDNGLGFTEEVINSLEEQIKEIDRTSLLPSLEINGMGLINIYIRFKLFYKGYHIFRVRNNIEGGATITLGGSIYDES